ncbi:MAG: FAD-dependent protein, partial [Candidatus Limivicinus sp.]
DGAVTGLHVHSPEGETVLPCRHVILAIGHSARDTVQALYEQGLAMERKPFAMGVRIEHRQADIDLAQYGCERGVLPAADYGLHIHLPDGTGVFTFCMCPGGEVIAAASEPGGLVTNGMSLSARDGENANSALLVGLSPDDFPGEGPLAGMFWQRAIEQAAWRCGGENALAPAQTVGSFLTGVPDAGPGRILPSYRPGVVWTDLHEILPPKITDALAAALPIFGTRLSGFDAPDAVLTGPETRSSSPVRMVRGADLSSSIRGLWPCGEGAGYAGGITSAAVDGMRCAEALMRSLGC